MRVLITTDTVGGVWTFTQELVQGLLEQSCDVALLSLGRQPTDQQQAWCSCLKEDWGDRFLFQSTSTPLEWMQGNDVAFIEAAPVIATIAELFVPDVLHCSQFCFGALPLDLPRIVTAHSDVLSWALCCQGLPLEDSKWLETYRSLVQKGLEDADAVVAPTHWMLKALEKNFALPSEQFVIPNGLKLGAFRRRRRRLQAVTAGRLWDDAKNIGLIADVDSPVPLLIAGEISCEQMTAPACLGTARLLGSLTQRALHELFASSALYICTSRYEPFGLAPLEAALCGCAVLANDIPSLREVWGDAALYFSNADGLSQLLSMLYADPKLLASAQARSLKRAQRYTRKAMALAYLSSYRDVLLRRGELSRVA